MHRTHSNQSCEYMIIDRLLTGHRREMRAERAAIAARIAARYGAAELGEPGTQDPLHGAQANAASGDGWDDAWDDDTPLATQAIPVAEEFAHRAGAPAPSLGQPFPR